MKAAVVTFVRAYNYGAVLQCYALCKSLQKLGIDVENLDEDVNIVVQIEGADIDDDVDIFDEDDDVLDEPNEWYFDDDPYEIVYYEFPDFD